MGLPGLMGLRGYPGSDGPPGLTGLQGLPGAAGRPVINSGSLNTIEVSDVSRFTFFYVYLLYSAELFDIMSFKI